MSKRGNGEGTIFRRKDGWWVAAYERDGKRKELWAKTRTDVAAKLNAALHALKTGEPAPAEPGTVTDLSAKWLDAIAARRRGATVRKYAELMRNHVLPELGRVQAARLAPEQLDHLYAKKLRTLSPTTVHHIHAAIQAMLTHALRRGAVVRNVASLVDAPAMAQREIVTLSEEQAQRFLDVVAGERLEALFVTLFSTGMRRSELLGLRWRDVDFAAREIHLRSTLERYHGEISFAEPKTKGSRRNIALAKQAVEALRRHRVAQNLERIAAGTAWTDRDLVFANEVGLPIGDQTFRRAYHRLLAAAGCPRIRIHDGRHTAFTILLGRGVHPKVVSELAGHSRISTTMDLYSHVTPTMQRQAIAEMEKALGGGR